jgi:hypothetical protein
LPHTEADVKRSNGKRGLRGRPRWDKTAGELWVNGELVKRFTRPAQNQRLILDAFEAEGWPRAIDDQLSKVAKTDARKYLRATINKLNQNMLRPLIRFRGTGNGKGVSWEWSN